MSLYVSYSAPSCPHRSAPALVCLWLANRLVKQPLQILPTVDVCTRMAVYVLNDGSVLAYNPIAPTEETLREFEDAFGGPGTN